MRRRTIRPATAAAAAVAVLLTVIAPVQAADAATFPLWWHDIAVPETRADTWAGAVAELEAATAEPLPIMDWLVSEPLKVEAGEGLGPRPPLVDRLVDGATLVYAGQTARFHARRADDLGRVRLNVPEPSGSVVVAAAELKVSGPPPRRLFLQGVGAAAVWVNGRLVTPAEGPALYLQDFADGDALEVSLQPGVNQLLLKVVRTGARAWWFAVRPGRHSRQRVRIKVLVTLADRFARSNPAECARAVVTAARLCLTAPESENDFAVTLYDRVRRWPSAPQAERRTAAWALVAYYRQRGMWARAARVLNETVADRPDTDPGEPATEPDELAGLLFALGEAQFRAGLPVEALGTFERIMAEFPSGRHTVEALLAQADVLRQLGLRERAAPLCRTVIRMTEGQTEPEAERRRATAQAILAWSEARWSDRPNLERDFEAELLIQRADELAARVASRAEDDPALAASAVDLYQRAIERGGEAFLERPGGEFVGVRHYCFGRLMDLLSGPHQASRLRLYDQRVDREVREQLYQADRPATDPADRDVRLRHVVARFGLSGAAEEALNRLGNETLSAGDYGRAGLSFGRLLTAPRPGGSHLAAQPSAFKAVVAKAAFCAANLSPATAPYLRLEEATPEAIAVSVAGRAFRVAAGADDAAFARWSAVQPPASPVGREWPTYGGSAARPGEMEGFRWMGPAYVTLPFADSLGAQVGRSQVRPNDGPGPLGMWLAHHAAVSTDGGDTRAFFHTDRMIYAVDVSRGEVAWRAGRWWGLPPEAQPENRWGPPATFFTTVAEGRVYARLRVPRRSRDDRPRWALYAVSAAEGRLLWSSEARTLLRPADGEAHPASDETVVSDPAYAHGQVFAHVRMGGDFPQHGLVALRADTGEVVWRTTLGSGPGALRIFAGWPAETYDSGDACPPPTVVGDTVIAVTNQGLVCALDALTGDARWARSYERAFVADGRSAQMRQLVGRALAPAAVRGRTVVVCPRDTQAVLGLDPATGALTWRVDLYDVQRLVGCDEGFAYLDGGDLLCVSLADGAVRWRHDQAAEPSVGLGVLVGRRLLLPQADQLLRRSSYRDRVDASTPWPAGTGPVGNLTLVGPHLVGFGREGLTIFTHSATPAFQARWGVLSRLAEAEALALKADWSEALRAAAGVTAPDARPDEMVRAAVVRARAAAALGDAPAARAAAREALMHDHAQLVRTADGWTSAEGLLEDYLPGLAAEAIGGARKSGDSITPRSCLSDRTPGVLSPDLRGWSEQLDPETAILADLPALVWPERVPGSGFRGSGPEEEASGFPAPGTRHPAPNFIVVSGRWLEARPIGDPTRVRWRVQAGAPPVRVSQRAGRVFLHMPWEVVCRSAASGRLLWRWSAAAEPAPGSPGPVQDILADAQTTAIATSGSIIVLDARTGERRWSIGISAPVDRLAAVGGGRVCAITGGAGGISLIAWDAVTGERRWQVPLRAHLAGPRIVTLVDGDTLWCADGASRTVARLSLDTGAVVARAAIPETWPAGTFLEVTREGPLVTALYDSSAVSQEGLWRLVFRADPLEPLFRVRGANPIIKVVGTEVLLAGGGALAVWDLETRRERWSAPAPERHHFLAATAHRPAPTGQAGRTADEGEPGWSQGLVVDAIVGLDRWWGLPVRTPRGLRHLRYARRGQETVILSDVPVAGSAYEQAEAARRPLGQWVGDRLVYAAADGAYVYRWRPADADAVGGPVEEVRHGLIATRAFAAPVEDNRWHPALERALSAPPPPAVAAEGLVRAAALRSPPVYLCRPVPAAVTVDGILDEWADVPAFTLDAWPQVRRPAAVQPDDDAISWDGPDDLWASIRATYDAGALYVAIEVVDDVHRPAGPGASLARGDAVELVIEWGGAAHPAPALHTVHLAAACRAGRTAVDLLAARPGGPPVQCAARQGRGGVVYEFAIPWRTLHPTGRPPAPAAGGAPTLGFGVLISDDDGRGVEAGLEFGAGISRGLVPAALGRLQLVPKE